MYEVTDVTKLKANDAIADRSTKDDGKDIMVDDYDSYGLDFSPNTHYRFNELDLIKYIWSTLYTYPRIFQSNFHIFF